MQLLKGIGVSPGVVIGRAFVLDDVTLHVPKRHISTSDIPHQHERLDSAVAASIEELQTLRDRVAREVDPEAAKILEFHMVLLRDPHFLDPVHDRIQEEQVSAEWAVTFEIRAMADKFRALDSEAFRSKVSDLLDLDRRLLRHLIGETQSRLRQVEGEVVIVAHDLTPSQTVSLDTQHVKAFVTDAGGRTSHTAIMARSIGIPAIVGLERATTDIIEDDLLIVDGDRGVLIIDPDDATLEEYTRRIEARRSYELSLEDLALAPAVTADGVRINLYGNIEFPFEVEMVDRFGGDGVGLYRSEFLFLAHDRDPSEEEQYEAFRDALRMSRGKPITIRTLDLGSDKYTQRRFESPERNPALGCRSIRFCLQNLPVFKTQLRAILRASVEGNLRMMFPLITGPLELRQARMVLSDVMEDLDDEGVPFNRNVPVGIMIEAPSAAIMSHAFAREVDFFSIGTNDLIQYTLAVDRTNERVANLYSAAHPAVLRLIKDCIRSGRRAGIEVSLCGEIASDPDYIMLLIGIGLRNLSLVPSAIPDIKRVIRAVDTRHCELIARKVGSFDSERQVLNFIRDETRKVMPEGYDGRSVEGGAA